MTWITIQSKLGGHVDAMRKGDLDLYGAIMADMNRCVRLLDSMGYVSKMDHVHTVAWVKQTTEHQLFLMEIAFGDYVLKVEEQEAFPPDVIYTAIQRSIGKTQSVGRALRK